MSDPPQVDDSSKLLQQIINNPDLAKKLGILLSNNDCRNTKRKEIPSCSPIKLKKVKIAAANAPCCSKNLPGGRSPDRIAPDPETSENGATRADTQSGEDNILEAESEEDADTLLEKLLNHSPSNHDSSSEDSQSDDDDAFDIMGDEPSPSWSPSQKSLDWFLKVADLDLKKDLITKIKEDYKGSEDIDSHFEPPRFPSALWSAVQHNHADVFRLKVILKAQENLYLSIINLSLMLPKTPLNRLDLRFLNPFN